MTTARYPWLLAVGGLILAAVLMATGCAPAPQLHGRAAFDRWIAEHVTIVHGPLDVKLPAAYYDWRARTVHYDDTRIPLEYGNTGEWLDVHEKAHAVALAVGLWIGDETCTADPYYCPPAERAAQAVTAVVLPGVVNPWEAGANLGYGTPLPAWVVEARHRMTLVGAW